MKRKEILSIAVIVFLVLVLAILAVASMPIWIPVLLVKPDIIQPVQNKITKNVTKRMVRQMMHS